MADDKDEHGYLVLLPGEIQTEPGEAGGQVPMSGPAESGIMEDHHTGDKDEHGYLVLLPGEIQTELGGAAGQVPESGAVDKDIDGKFMLLPEISKLKETAEQTQKSGANESGTEDDKD